MLLLFLFRSISLGCLLDLQQLGILELNGHPGMVVMQ